MNRRWHSSTLYVPSFRQAECDTDHYPMIAEVRGRQSINKLTALKYIGKWVCTSNTTIFIEVY